jgi:hypothetical protein
MSEVTETTMQAVLMRWCMGVQNHIMVVPNSTVIYPWESDLISITNALYAHEYEIKISKADYNKDKEKKWKHISLVDGFTYGGKRPNYFWYATFSLEIEPPEHAGWINVRWDERRQYYAVDVIKQAPKLAAEKITDKQQTQIAKLLSWRMSNYYTRYIHENIEPIQQPEVATL